MQKRYFIELAFDGFGYSGWQKQKNATTIQQELETAMETLLESRLDLVGCGRTDAGVHASQFYAHFEFDKLDSQQLIYKLNRFLSPQFRIFNVFEVDPEMHARYSAVARSYEYRIHLAKNPFERNFSYYFPSFRKLDIEKLHDSAAILLSYTDFFPFCKTNTDVETTICSISESKWVINEEDEQLRYSITSNRFLRGMVRLIVGMCLNVSMGKLTLTEVQEALQNRTRLTRDWSVPAHGLFLTKVDYS